MTRMRQTPGRAAWLLPALLMTAPRPLAAQAPAAPPAYNVAIDDLRAPTSPAFSILGVTPASVDRPQNAKALTVNLLSAASTGDGIPRHYALELTPYWFGSHPDLTFTDYYSQNAGLSLLRTLSLSVATAPLSPKTPADGTKLALGVRTMLVPGHANALLADLRAQLLVADKILIGRFKGLDGLKAERDRAALTLVGVTDPARQARLTKLIAEDDEKIANLEMEIAKQEKDPAVSKERQAAAAAARALTARIRDLDAQRDGFMIALAAGQVWGFPGDTAADGSRATAGVWMTPSYRVRPCAVKAETLACESSVDLIGVVRYLSDPTSQSEANRWDVGGRLVWQINKPLAVSVEAVRRNRPIGLADTSSTQRAVAMAEYRITDGTLFFGSFGKDFDNAEHKTLVTILGLNFGLGQKPLIDLSK